MNPFILHKDDEFDTHLVIFSALNTPKGKFTLYKILSSFPGKKTFINIDRNHWYQHNIPSMGSSLEDSVDAIKSITKKKNTIYIGSSMGGTGAALHGIKNKAKHVICFGAEYVLQLPFSRSKLHMPEDIKVKYHDLTNLFSNATDTTFYIFSGELDIIDLYNASLLPYTLENIHIIIIKNTGHNVTKSIHENFIKIDKFIETVIKNDNEATKIFHCEYSGKDYFSKYNIHEIYNAYVLIRNRKYDQAIEVLDSVKHNNITNPLYNLYYGMALTRQKKPAAALPFLTRSVKIAKNRDTYFELGIALNHVNKFDEAINNYKCCINEDPNYAPAYHHIGLIFEKVKDYKTSELYLKKAYSIKPDNLRYKNDLIRVLDIIYKSYSELIKELKN